ncbi:DEHA2E16852p [Debaryomyces hansenii CBS767]|uniref:DEHA2E16852p n=1 Tax=Debaryomyces hansenii (strain ATCC 36239 / CBS 767 / BCRC 21394 / JCM 1990 / NBRC 0083 / IGC 2968) TaxID=284592 RepID=B5RU28_DEBHA|nr:DEHA2E16852p [Debaryomyces hansenii CBS767]CAR65840.1 DEHA2E16852p [Debaryomyces hansenii CBS767]|eukprot:XP_002770497.1 DEHA2E16852p [Debaryomyces hansenii CBS767]
MKLINTTKDAACHWYPSIWSGSFIVVFDDDLDRYFWSVIPSENILCVVTKNL